MPIDEAVFKETLKRLQRLPGQQRPGPAALSAQSLPELSLPPQLSTISPASTPTAASDPKDDSNAAPLNVVVHCTSNGSTTAITDCHTVGQLREVWQQRQGQRVRLLRRNEPLRDDAEALIDGESILVVLEGREDDALFEALRRDHQLRGDLAAALIGRGCPPYRAEQLVERMFSDPSTDAR